MAARTVLITGGCGFIGAALIRLLKQERTAWRLVNLDRLTYAANAENLEGIAEGPGYRFIHGDVADRDLVFRLVEEEHPADVIHLAAESHVDRSIIDATAFLRTNVLGTHVLLEAVRRFGIERFLHVSTDEVYGDVGRDGTPCTEESPLRPSSPYAASKAAGDLLCQAYRRTYGLPILIARPCNHYGPRQFPEKLVPFMIRRLIRHERLPLYGDGRQRRDWLYVEDGTRALLAVLERGAVGGIYNIAAHGERENHDVVQLLCAQAAREQGISPEPLLALIEHVADRPGHDVRYALDDGRLRTEIGWTPRTSFEDGVAQTVRWYLAHRSWLEHVAVVDYQPHFQPRPTQPEARR